MVFLTQKPSSWIESRGFTTSIAVEIRRFILFHVYLCESERNSETRGRTCLLRCLLRPFEIKFYFIWIGHLRARAHTHTHTHTYMGGKGSEIVLTYQKWIFLRYTNINIWKYFLLCFWSCVLTSMVYTWKWPLFMALGLFNFTLYWFICIFE